MTDGVGHRSRRLVRLAAAADQLGICTKTLRRYIADGRLPAYRLGPKMLYLDLDDVERLMRRVG